MPLLLRSPPFGIINLSRSWISCLDSLLQIFFFYLGFQSFNFELLLFEIVPIILMNVIPEMCRVHKI